MTDWGSDKLDQDGIEAESIDLDEEPLRIDVGRRRERVSTTGRSTSSSASTYATSTDAGSTAGTGSGQGSGGVTTKHSSASRRCGAPGSTCVSTRAWAWASGGVTTQTTT